MPHTEIQNRTGYCPSIPNEQMQTQRNAYRYPAVALLGVPSALTHTGFSSTHALDSYFNGMLHSTKDDDKVLAYLGIIYWGHYSGAAGIITLARAMGKANLTYRGQTRIHKGRTQRMRGVVDITLRTAAELIDNAAASIAANRYGEAVGILMGLPGIGFAFATKICAFLDPEKCGVADSLIASKYPGFGFSVDRVGYITNTAANKTKYDQYCICLQTTALSLNAAPPPCSNWTDRDGTSRPWRAIDVERALY